MSETETRYAQIEKEALATTWACERFSTYILGMKFTIETDHKLLVPLLGSKNLDRLPPRILRFRLRLARFDYTIVHVAGKHLYTADTLSRAPADNADNDLELQQDAERFVEVGVLNLPTTEHKLLQYQKAQDEDQLCCSVKKYCLEGWPEKRALGHNLTPYWNERGHITVGNHGLLLYGNRILVPPSLRKETLSKLHNGHQGIQRCRLRAKVSVWWPGIMREIENMISQCHTCARQFSPRKEPMIPTELPDYPWQRVGTDLFHLNGDNYLVVVDYFSRYPEIKKLSSTTSTAIIQTLKSIFSRLGIPQQVVSDNGPQFASQHFTNFAKSYDFQHVTSSPHFAQSNGLAERTVQTVKRLLKESEDPHMALLTYRSTPFPWCKLSPAELLMGRRIRGNTPVLTDQLTPDWTFIDDFRAQNINYKAKQKEDYDRRHAVHSRPPLSDDTEVWITSGQQPTQGTVVRPAHTPRSYIVDTPTGTIRRNRQHLNRVPSGSNQSDSTETQGRDPIMTRSRSGTAIQPPSRL